MRDRINGLRENTPIDPQARFAARMQQTSQVELQSAVVQKEAAAAVRQMTDAPGKPDRKSPQRAAEEAEVHALSEKEQREQDEAAEKRERQHDEIVMALEQNRVHDGDAAPDASSPSETIAAKLRLHTAQQFYNNK